MRFKKRSRGSSKRRSSYKRKKRYARGGGSSVRGRGGISIR